MAQCADCLHACPHQALSLGRAGIQLDAGACNGCGDCAGACPARAIAFARPEPVRDGATFTLVCARHPQARGLPAPTCIQGYGLNDFAAWALAGVQDIACGTADCASCPDAGPMRLDETAARFAPLAQDRGVTAPRIRPATAADLRNWARRADDGPAPARRALLRALTAPLRDDAPAMPALTRLQSRAGTVFAFAPVIDAAACTGCDACIRLCPEDALIGIKEPDQDMRYHVSAEACTGCLICEDVCTDSAIEVFTMTPAPHDIPLTGFCCRACGAQTHLPTDGGRAATGLCAICARTGHHRKLFQVLS